MKRKLMCLFLVLAMAFSCFAVVGCSSDEDETLEGSTTDETALTTVTLTLWIPTDRKTTDEAILAVQEALNKILKADAGKLPESVKDFKYYVYAHKSGNATTTEMAVRSAWASAKCDLLADSEKGSPYHVFGESDAKMSKLSSGRVLLLYSAEKELLGYSLIP